MIKVWNVIGKTPMSLLVLIWMTGLFGYVAAPISLSVFLLFGTVAELLSDKQEAARIVLVCFLLGMIIWIPYIGYIKQIAL